MALRFNDSTGEAALKKHAQTAADLVFALDGMYHVTNRGQSIGGWRVLSFEPGVAVVENNTPQPCKMEEGILSQALMSLGVPAIVRQTSCFRDDADTCIFELSSSVGPARWGTTSKA